MATAKTAAKAVAKATTPSATKSPVKSSAAKPVGRAVANKAAAPATPRTASVAKPAAEAGGKIKHKLVRDSFTIPKSEYAVLQSLKQRAADLKRPVKKSELLRAGISALNAMAAPAFLAALDVVPSLKTGRPKTKNVAA